MIRKMLFVSTLAIVIVLMASTAFANAAPWGTPGDKIEIIISPSGDKTKPGATGIQVVIFWTEGVIAPINIDVNIEGVVGPSD